MRKRYNAVVCAAVLCAMAANVLARAQNVPVSWSSGWSDAEYVVNGSLPNDDSELDAFPWFLARCEPGQPRINLWFFVDHPRFKGQTVDSSGMRGPYRYRTASVVIDGTTHTLEGAKLTPEESSGGHELSLEVPRSTPLLTLLRNGASFFVRVDDFTMPPLSLSGAAKAIDEFTENCKRPRRR